MKSKITIEVDFDQNNTPYIRLLVDKNSDDVRDKLLRAFLEKLGHESVFGKIVCKSDATEENVQRWGIYPMPAERIEEELSFFNSLFIKDLSSLQWSDRFFKSKIPVSDRRYRIDLHSSAEIAIRTACLEVEKLGADERLTNAVELLQKAQNLVSDVLDEKLDRLSQPL